MDDIFINRVETALSDWRSQEERAGKLLPSGDINSRVLQKEKLDYYFRIAALCKGTKDLGERFALKVLRQERDQIEKRLYPNPAIRLIRHFLIRPVKERTLIRREKRLAEQNSHNLVRQVQQMGFSNLSGKIEMGVWRGQRQFFIEASHYLNEKERIDHQLAFRKDSSNAYRFEGYKTVLSNEAKPEEKRHHYFDMRGDHAINAKEAYNLLSGRFVQNGGAWLQLDFNEKDQNGNFRLKQFPSDFGYNLDKVLGQLPLKEFRNAEEAGRLAESLRNGDRVAVSLIKDGREQRFYIEANAQYKSLNIFDEHFKKTTIQAALMNKTMVAMKVSHKINQQPQVSQKKGVRVKR